ncbi:unnamed protein product [Bursaphelenchus xylophilus]|uniref:(pine wood nematode) hypothetical protein n=1 Tax=Bursaphelenchus xylophilus TaxID=6326 RepID=A0A1I7RXY4_BURXY|nr:unnamed protein product [Bursaphelenchus xylophilus]CAG9125251.1 unnamed protein product [Bursaphelenchus xylophilus]
MSSGAAFIVAFMVVSVASSQILYSPQGFGGYNSYASPYGMGQYGQMGQMGGYGAMAGMGGYPYGYNSMYGQGMSGMGGMGYGSGMGMGGMSGMSGMSGYGYPYSRLGSSFVGRTPFAVPMDALGKKKKH